MAICENMKCTFCFLNENCNILCSNMQLQPTNVPKFTFVFESCFVNLVPIKPVLKTSWNEWKVDFQAVTLTQLQPYREFEQQLVKVSDSCWVKMLMTDSEGVISLLPSFHVKSCLLFMEFSQKPSLKERVRKAANIFFSFAAKCSTVLTSSSLSVCFSEAFNSFLLKHRAESDRNYELICDWWTVQVLLEVRHDSGFVSLL